MKALTTFADLGTVTSSGSNTGYPESNVVALDPGLVWRASSYTGDVWIKFDMGAAATLTALFANRANFPSMRIQGNSTDSWTSPPFNVLCALSRDDAGNRKGWYNLSGFNYRWLRILIPGGQTLDFGSVPEVGNVIAGIAVEMPIVRDLTIDIARVVSSWQSDGGSLRKRFRGVPRHILTLEVADTLASVRAFAKAWDHAVIFADLGDAGGAWLVYAPERITMPIRHPADAGARLQVEERV
jgi:hypothetical protein